jgi:DNA-directed RNA polymerase specialized sigma24 family protein
VNLTRCDKERKTMAAVCSTKANSEIAKHAQTCPVCSEILLVNAFLRRLKRREWQLLWQAYIEQSSCAKIARTTGLSTDLVGRELSHARAELTKLIRARLGPGRREIFQ